MKAFNNSTKKQKILGLVILGFLFIITLFYDSDFSQPADRQADAEKVSQLQKRENEDLQKLTGKEPGKISSFSISNSQDSATPGSQAQFVGKFQGEGNYDRSIAWAIVSLHGGKTQIDSQGLLTLDPEEREGQLTIEASVDKGAFKDRKVIQVQGIPPLANKPASQAKNRAELKAIAQTRQAQVTPEEKAKKDQEDKKVEQTAIFATSKRKKDQYQAAPTPAGKPKPVEPGSVAKQDKLEACTLSIQCKTILDNIDRFNLDKIDVLPTNGIILPETSVEFHPGESVFDILDRETKARKIHIKSNFTPAYNSAYIMGIDNLYEFDYGELSGWMYKVNGWFLNYGRSRYEAKVEDKTEWPCTCDLSRDIGDNSMAK